MEQMHEKSKIRVFTFALIACGAYQAVLAMLQLYGFEQSRHNLYAFTGTFLNPGPFCGYIAFILPLALDEWLEWRGRTLLVEKAVGFLFAAVCLLFIMLLPAGMSRAAWVSASVSSLFVLGKRYPGKMSRPLLLGAMAAVVGAVLLVASVLLFHFKEDSAKGRLLVWKITAGMIAERPLTGYGTASFSSKYMDAQEAYFHNHPHAPEWEARVAETPEYAFNDYLQLACGRGLPALVLALALPVLCYCHARRMQRWGVCGAWISLGIFALASYPLEVPLFVVSVGLLGGASLVGTCIRKRDVFLRTGLFLLLIAACAFRYDPVDHWQEANALFNKGLMLNREGRYEESNRIMEQTLGISGDAMILNVKGRNYQAMKRYKEAEQCFRRAIDRRPNRLYPHYLLVRLYREKNYFHPRAARKEAEIVLHKDPKVMSPAVIEMRREVLCPVFLSPQSVY